MRVDTHSFWSTTQVLPEDTLTGCHVKPFSGIAPDTHTSSPGNACAIGEVREPAEWERARHRLGDCACAFASYATRARPHHPPRTWIVSPESAAVNAIVEAT